MEILIKRLDNRAKLPVYNREASSGIDLFALEEVVVPANDKLIVATGIALALPVGYVGLICNQYQDVIKGKAELITAIIDSGFRDEIVIELVNKNCEPQSIKAGEKIAQLFLQQAERPLLIEAEDLES